MIKKIKTLTKILSIFAFLILLLQVQAGPLAADESKDLILILDTSLSMVGYGGRNILPQVKKSLPKFIDQLEEDDSITFMTFDTNVKVYPTIYIDDDNDKDILNKYISVIDAKGKWTYTSLMIKHALQKAQEMEERDEDRQRIIVVMTDAIDDPPPGMQRDRLNIKKIAKPYKEKDWFVFLMNFGDIKKNEKLAKELKKLTKYTKIIEPSKVTKGEVQDAIEKDLKKNIEKMAEKKEEDGSSIGTIFIVILIIGIVLLALYYLKRYADLKVSGKLEFWDHTIIAPYNRDYDLTKQESKMITVGKKGNVRIDELEINDPFIISAVRDEGEVKNSIQAGKGYNIKFVNRDPGSFLQNGDIFKVENYTFKYTL